LGAFGGVFLAKITNWGLEKLAAFFLIAKTGVQNSGFCTVPGFHGIVTGFVPVKNGF